MKLTLSFWFLFTLASLLCTVLRQEIFFLLAFLLGLFILVHRIMSSRGKASASERKTMLKNTAVVLLVLLVLFASRIRIITADGCTLLLFDNPAHAGSSSFGRKVKEDFASAGKTPDNVTIQYIGTNSGGDYFLCEYRESDGSVSKYYAFEDNDHNSGLPAKVLWE